MRKYCICMLLCAAFLNVGCSYQHRMEHAIEKFKSEKVTIPFHEMSCWINDTLQNERPWERAEMKMVVYMDHTKCSGCMLRKLFIWEDFIKMEKEYNNRFYIFFILQAPDGARDADIAAKFYMTEINHPIYIDSKSELAKQNHHLPKESACHTFLLDKDGNVVLIGDPLYHIRTENQLRHIVREALSPESSEQQKQI